MNNIFFLNINNRAFHAINDERKKIEIRANKKGKIDYSLIDSNDYIVFKNKSSSDNLVCKVVRTKWYASVRTLLESEGTQYSLSSTNSIEEGIVSIESIADYKEIIDKNGVYAIAIKKISEVIAEKEKLNINSFIEKCLIEK